MSVAFIGLGVMGFPMAAYLAKNGLDVRVYNRTAAKAASWVKENGGTACATPREAADGADVVFACVGNDDDLRSVVLGDEGAFAGMKSGTLFVDHTTASAAVARELYSEGSQRGIEFLDAPVSGGQAGAENGQLTVMVGGDQPAFDKAEPLIQHFAKSVRLLGPSGAGQLTKMVNQICIAGLVQGLSEALHFAECAGLDGRAGMRKDLGIVLDEAKRNRASLPVTALVDQFYADVQDMGGNRWDTSALLARLPKPKT